MPGWCCAARPPRTSSRSSARDRRAPARGPRRAPRLRDRRHRGRPCAPRPSERRRAELTRRARASSSSGSRSPAPDVARAGVDPSLVTPDAMGLLRDARADVVVELIGGAPGVGELVEAAIDGGASVVTANKALLAARLRALTERAAHEGRRPVLRGGGRRCHPDRPRAAHLARRAATRARAGHRERDDELPAHDDDEGRPGAGRRAPRGDGPRVRRARPVRRTSTGTTRPRRRRSSPPSRSAPR